MFCFFLVVANRDDPNIVSAAFDHPAVRWISGGVRWKHDALTCPRCGTFLGEADGDWHCRCGLHRPPADWTVTEQGLRGPNGQLRPLSLSLPGQPNRINAAFALAAALDLGCEQQAVLDRVGRIDQAEGRYGELSLGGRSARLLLAKNPASWLEMLELVSGGDDPLVLVVNSREADGHDVSWLWDIDFETLRGRSVSVCGDRGWDLAVRLRYAGVDATVHSTVDEALHGGGHRRPDVIANYTAFRDLYARRGRA